MKIMCNGFVLPSVPHRDLNIACITYRLIIITHLLPNDSKGLKGVSGSILLHAVCGKNGKGMFLYSVVSSLLDHSKRFVVNTLPPDRPVHSDTNWASLWIAF